MNNLILSPIPLPEMENLINHAVNQAFEKFVINQINPAPESKSDIIFLNEVCKLTNLKKATIYVLVNQKKIPFIKPEGTKKLMFSRIAIIEWLQTGRPVIEY